VRVVLGSGAFDWTDTKLTSAVLALFALSFIFQSAQLFLTRAHYALGKTKVPLLFGLSGAVVTIGLAVLLYFNFLGGLMSWLQQILEIENVPGSKIIILPFSFSFGAMFTALGLWFSLEKETKHIAQNGMLKTLRDAVLTALIVGTVTFYALRIFDNFFNLDSLFGVLGHSVVSGFMGIVCGVVFLWIIKNKEFRKILGQHE
jgi:peptidoglycan biosynthesis protein MviN/MurJ (putative lipid II flippase)